MPSVGGIHAINKAHRRSRYYNEEYKLLTVYADNPSGREALHPAMIARSVGKRSMRSFTGSFCRLMIWSTRCDFGLEGFHIGTGYKKGEKPDRQTATQGFVSFMYIGTFCCICFLDRADGRAGGLDVITHRARVFPSECESLSGRVRPNTASRRPIRRSLPSPASISAVMLSTQSPQLA